MNESVRNTAGDPSFASLARTARVIPVVTIERADDAVPLARALVAGGLSIIEITLRTRAALDAIRAIAAEVPQAHVGAGTIRTAENGADAVAAGARFIVSPGATDRLLDAAGDWNVPYLPGAATASEMMALAERGITFMKLFPAEAVGGVNLLKSLAAPLHGIEFCPTGGITPENFAAYLALSNVACIGGSWMIPAPLVESRNWEELAKLALEARNIAAS